MLQDILLYLLVFCLSFVPALESRFAIPFAAGLGLNLESSLIVVLLGNSLAIPIALLLVSLLDKFLLATKNKTLKPISELYKKTSFRAAEKVRGRVEKLGYIGLSIFVAIPIPGSGIWTGALAAQILRLSHKKTSAALLVGQVIAALLVFSMVKGILHVLPTSQ